MTAREVRKGMPARLEDPAHIRARFWCPSARAVVGTGGMRIAPHVLEGAGIIAERGGARGCSGRVRLEWPGGWSMWLEAADVVPA